ARVPDLSAAGPGEDYVALRHFGALGFNATRSTDDSVTANTDYWPLHPFLRMTRSGGVFTLYTRPDLNTDWVQRDQVSRPDLAGVADLQVGLWFGTFLTGDVGQVQFDNFVLTTEGSALPPLLADAGGPYTTVPGLSVQLDASATLSLTQVPDTLTYLW